ncbi:glycosyltransferase family 4 protein [Echinicola rosea]|uniref:LPS biosynthesis protein RfbU n=1 Tax=Echinicola rosea TaxID=1807691 RepID=A0ABQ1VB52_9BACT|nr:glycosyltransferase [Echinicola rosea]GGF44783.1 LPS biosynthesis protein RfbU [Echinicola rosea]
MATNLSSTTFATSNNNKTEIETKTVPKSDMKVLFVSSGNLKNFDVAPFIKVQGDSLINENIEVDYFRVVGKGLKGYFSNVKRLKEHLKRNSYDLIHAHFTLSAWVAVLAKPNLPIVLSLMGTDAYGRVNKLSQNKPSLNYLTILSLLIQPFVKKIISKSPNIEQVVWQKGKSHLLPNGVNMEDLLPYENDFKKELNLSPEKKYVLFLGNPKDLRKNYKQLQTIKEQLAEKNIEVIAPYPISHNLISKYLNSVDALIMCSFQEGSPNVVKEAMACNCKGVFTDVGDVRYLVNNTKGYFICDFTPEDLFEKIIKVVSLEECAGRTRLFELGLSLPKVATKLKNIYLSVLR